VDSLRDDNVSAANRTTVEEPACRRGINEESVGSTFPGRRLCEKGEDGRLYVVHRQR
jgi:hypothetical protein